MFVSTFFADAASAMPPDEEMTPKPVDLFSIGGFSVNNSMVSEAIVTVLLVIICQLAMRSPKIVPTGLQNFVEFVVESIANFLELITGRDTAYRGFWFFAGLFIFIVSGNLLALVPGVGTFGLGHGSFWNFDVDRPFLRGANANDNLTAAYSAIFFFMFFYWAFKAAGFKGFMVEIFGSKVKFPNALANAVFVVIFFIVGWVDVFSILIIRPIAFTFRLFGNIYGGEFLLDSIYKMAPHFAFILLVPFYFYELLVAVVQALVFFILTAAFTGIVTNVQHAPDGESTH